VFLVLLVEVNHRHFDVHIEDESYIGDTSAMYYELRGIETDAWIALRSISGTSFFERGNGDQIIENLMDIFNAQCIIISPLIIENLGFGYAVWGWKNKISDSREFISKAELIGEQIALSLSASMSEKRSKEQGDKLAALLDLSTHIYSSLNYKDVLQKAVKLSKEIVGATGGTIFILEKEKNVLVPLLTIDESHEEAINSMRLKPGQGLTGRVAQTGVGMISNDSESDPRSIQVPGTPLEPESLISVPLTWSGDVIGVITLRNNVGKMFVQEDLEILTIFARQTADAIENAKLYEKLEKAYEELSATQDRLIMVEKLKALADMAGGVAHDFNNILGTILGRVQLLQKKIDNPELRGELETIETATLEGRTTVRKLQDFTHLSGRSQYAKADLNKVTLEAIENTSPAWKSAAQRSGITINLHSDLKSIPMAKGSHDDLREAVSNVILNSVDALPEGGNIWISTEVSDGRALLRIVDDGIGMDEDTKNKMFFPFFSTKDKKGSGMGLSMVYGIMFRNQADISVESSPGKGAEFTFIFSLPEEIELGPPVDEISAKPSDLKILLVDDEVSLLDVVGDMLDYMGHTCRKADGGRVALEILEQEEFDLVVTDLGMPEVGGWEVAQLCRNKYPRMPVILISGWGAQLDGEEALQRVDAVLAKPFRMEEFEEMINSVISKSKRKLPVS
jgi:signal transduction histidine kinase/ActR/RegA family two-component response regulator